MQIEIRPERPEEHYETEAMTRRSFYNKYNPGCSEHLLVHQVRNHPDHLPQFSRIAVVDGAVAGLILYTRSWIVTETEEIETVTFGPLCVDHRYKNHGIGRKLLETTIPLIKEAGYPGILIMGEPDYYPKHGFQRAREFGLTTMDGQTGDAFMGLELTEGGLHIPGGKFRESEAFENISEEELEEFDLEFEFLGTAIRPCQWGYDNATEENQGYHLESAINRPEEFKAMFRKYGKALAAYDPNMHKLNVELAAKAIWNNVSAASFVILVGDQPAGLLVTSAPETEEEEELYAGFLEEIFVDEPYRGRGIGSDIFYRYFRQQPKDAGYCVLNKNEYALKKWKNLLESKGMTLQQYPAGEEHTCFIVGKHK